SHPTILSGDIGEPADIADNAYHVLIGADDATLDGFTVTAGNADLVGRGRRYGGGLYNVEASPAIANATFSQNTALVGGAIYNDSASPTITNATFSENTALMGGAIYNDSASPTIANTTFSQNIAGEAGGAIDNRESSTTI